MFIGGAAMGLLYERSITLMTGFIVAIEISAFIAFIAFKKKIVGS